LLAFYFLFQIPYKLELVDRRELLEEVDKLRHEQVDRAADARSAATNSQEAAAQANQHRQAIFDSLKSLDQKVEQILVALKQQIPAASAAAAEPILKKEQWSTIQRVLQKQGIYRGSIDGDPGDVRPGPERSQTRAAIREWQRRNGLLSDGSFDTDRDREIAVIRYVAGRVSHS
jgi:putative peptidoglycan binding protein